MGGNLGAIASRWTGNGDYTVSKNSLVTASPNGTIPAMHKNDQTVTIRHKEYLGTISGSTSFTVQKELVVNPGLNNTFPWLSGIAQQFEQYHVKGMVYHYVPTSGTFSGTSAALGAVMFQTTYRATDQAPVSKVEMLNEYWSTETVASQQCVHAIECDPKENPFNIHYVRTVAAPGEPLMYDLARTFVATQGMDSTNVVGDLWVTYEIELKKPVVSSNASPSENFSAILYSAPTTTAFFDSTILERYGTPHCTASGRTLTFPRGERRRYHISLTFTGAIDVLVPASMNAVVSTSNCTPVLIGGMTQQGWQLSSAAAATNTETYICNIEIPSEDLIPSGQFSTVTFPPVLNTNIFTVNLHFAISPVDIE